MDLSSQQSKSIIVHNETTFAHKKTVKGLSSIYFDHSNQQGERCFAAQRHKVQIKHSQCHRFESNSQPVSYHPLPPPHVPCFSLM